MSYHTRTGVLSTAQMARVEAHMEGFPVPVTHTELQDYRFQKQEEIDATRTHQNRDRRQGLVNPSTVDDALESENITLAMGPE